MERLVASISKRRVDFLLARILINAVFPPNANAHKAREIQRRAADMFGGCHYVGKRLRKIVDIFSGPTDIHMVFTRNGWCVKMWQTLFPGSAFTPCEYAILEDAADSGCGLPFGVAIYDRVDSHQLAWVVFGHLFLETIQMHKDLHNLMEIANGMGLAGDFMARPWIYAVFTTEFALGSVPRSLRDPGRLMLHDWELMTVDEKRDVARNDGMSVAEWILRNFFGPLLCV